MQTDISWCSYIQNDIHKPPLLKIERLLLALLFRQPLQEPPRIDFLDFCLEHMIAKRELPGVQSLCMKLAYELCRNTPELLQELTITLDMLEHDLVPSIRTVRKNILKAIPKRKSLQCY